MPKTYTPLARQVITTPSASVTFSSISSAYTDLILVAQYQCSANGGLWIRYNGDTGTNYSVVNMIGSQNTISSYADSNEAYIWADTYYQGTGTVLSDRAIVKAQIMNYSNTTTFKTTLCRGDDVRTTGATDGTVNANVSTWRSTSAINSVNCIPAGSMNFVSGSTFTLYGILKA
jgi:hypothetical protein